MGTRHLTAVMLNGEYKVAQYGQWDGYPSGQGTNILGFLRSLDRNGFNKFAERVRLCRFIDQAEIEERWTSVGATKNGASMDVADKFYTKWPGLGRDTGSDVLHLILGSRQGVDLKNSIDFAGESLFCEWAYVIDLDKFTFEVFEGFNKEPVDPSERFASAPLEGNEYKQVKHKKTYALDALPTEEEFLAELEPKNEED